jgi:predicted nucleic acid-binding protein
MSVTLATGEIEDQAIGAGHSPGLGDAIIAATARAGDLIVVTENIVTSSHWAFG